MAPDWFGDKKWNGNGRPRRAEARRVDGLRKGGGRKKGPCEALGRRLWKKATSPRSPAATQSARVWVDPTTRIAIPRARNPGNQGARARCMAGRASRRLGSPAALPLQRGLSREPGNAPQCSQRRVRSPGSSCRRRWPRASSAAPPPRRSWAA